LEPIEASEILLKSGSAMTKKRKTTMTKSVSKPAAEELNDAGDIGAEIEFDEDVELDVEEIDDDDDFIKDEPSDILMDDGDEDFDDEDLATSIRTETADDPVRMYLKEIGQVPLLDSNREMWLSTQIAAERLLQSLIDKQRRRQSTGR
jgi:RNA polymerase primary sigma factor